MGQGKGLEGLSAAHRKVPAQGLKDDPRGEFTLDIDATQIIAEKKHARRTYKGERGYMPIVGHFNSLFCWCYPIIVDYPRPDGHTTKELAHKNIQYDFGGRV